VEAGVLGRRVAPARARRERGRERDDPRGSKRTRPSVTAALVHAHTILGGTKGPGTATTHCSPSQKPPGSASQHSCVVGGKIGGQISAASLPESLPESLTMGASIAASVLGVWLDPHAASAVPRVTAWAARRARARARR